MSTPETKKECNCSKPWKCVHSPVQQSQEKCENCHKLSLVSENPMFKCAEHSSPVEAKETKNRTLTLKEASELAFKQLDDYNKKWAEYMQAEFKELTADYDEGFKDGSDEATARILGILEGMLLDPIRGTKKGQRLLMPESMPLYNQSLFELKEKIIKSSIETK